MSKSTHLLGKTSGRIGATVFKIVHGQQIVQEYQPKITNPNSEAQRNQRARFKLMQQLAAVMSPYAVYQREGLTSPRNIFVRENFRNTVAGGGDAAAALLNMQFAKGTIAAPVINTFERDETFEVLMTGYDKTDYDAMFAIIVERVPDGSLSVLYAKSIGIDEQMQAYGTAEIPVSSNEQFAYLYGVKFSDETSRVAYEDYIVNAGTDVANLVANRILRVDNAQYTKTVSKRIAATSAEYNIQVYSQNAQMGTVAKTVDEQTHQVTLTATPKAGNIFLGWRRTGTQEIINTNPYIFLPVKDETFWGMFLQQSPQA